MKIRSAKLVLGAAAGAIALLWLGLWTGSLLRGGPVDRLAPEGSLVEVHLVDGTVYLGGVRDAGSDYLALANPAVVLPKAGDSASNTFIIQPLSGDPYDIHGMVLIPRGQVALIGGVAAGSGLAAAYDDAMRGGAPESPAPS